MVAKHIVRLNDGENMSWSADGCFVKLIRGKSASFDFGLYHYSWHIDFSCFERKFGKYIVAPLVQIVPVFCKEELIKRLIDEMEESGAYYTDWSNESNFTILNGKVVVVDIDKHNHYPGPLVTKQHNPELFELSGKLLNEMVRGGIDCRKFHKLHAEAVEALHDFGVISKFF